MYYIAQYLICRDLTELQCVSDEVRCLLPVAGTSQLHLACENLLSSFHNVGLEITVVSCT